MPGCKLTAKQVVEGLGDGGALATTIQKGGEVIHVESGEVIGHVVNVDNNLEYSEFVLE